MICQLVGGPLHGSEYEIDNRDQSCEILDPNVLGEAFSDDGEMRIISMHLIRRGLYSRDPLNPSRFLWAGWLKPIGGESNDPPQGECLDLGQFPTLIMD